MNRPLAFHTLDAKRANDFAPKNYQIVTKIGRSLFSRGKHGKCQICTLNREKCTDLVHFWSDTHIDGKTIGSDIMMRMVPIWYNLKMCTNL